MKNMILIGVIIVMAIGGFVVYSMNVNNIDEMAEMAVLENEVTEGAMDSNLEDGPTVTPISHASMILAWGGQTIYVDPVGGSEAYTDLMAPDLVLLTDIHGDHLNVETLAGIVSPTTQLVMPQAVYDELSAELQAQAVVLANGETTDLAGLTIEAMPMYNFPETEDSRHVKGRGNGYLVERDGYRVYIAGDTAGIPEMLALTDIDMAFLPMNLPYTMSVDEAAEATLAFAPKTAIPYHYRGMDGLSDVNRYKSLVEAGNPNIQVLLLNWYPEPAADDEEADTAVSFDVQGSNYEFDVEEIRVKAGDRVTINFESADGFHDWVVDEFDAATEQVRPGDGVTSVTFVADEAGTYEYYCSVGAHRAQGMVGTLIVE